MRRNFLMLALVLALHHAACGAGYSTSSGTAPESPTETYPKQVDTMKVRLKIKDTVLSATLTDSKTAQDFVSLLPITLTMNDLFGREKYGHLPRELSCCLHSRRASAWRDEDTTGMFDHWRGGSGRLRDPRRA